MTRVRISLAAVGASTLIALGAAGCGDITENGDPEANGDGGAGSRTEVNDDPATLNGRTFVSTEINEQGGAPGYLKQAEIRLSFEKGGNRINGDVGCNGIFGAVSPGGGTLSIDNVGRTEMACQGPVMRQEEWLVDLLESEPSWKLTENDRLRLESDGTELVLAEEKKDQSEDAAVLRETTWQLDSVGEADGGQQGTARHSKAMEKAELEFAAPRDESQGQQDGQEGEQSDQGQQSEQSDQGQQSEQGQQSQQSEQDGQGQQSEQDGQGQQSQQDEKAQAGSGAEPGQQEKLRVQGTSGCNDFGGRVTIANGDPNTSSDQDGVLRFGKLTSTLKACTDEQTMQLEKQLVGTLKGAVPYTLQDEKLTLHGDEHELTFSAH